MKQVALITGASSGIGLALAHQHAQIGGDLVIVSRKFEDLQVVQKALESQYGVSVVCIAKDLSLPHAAQEIYAELKQRSIEIQYLMNNAGFGGQGYFYLREMKKDLDMIQVNVVALTELTRLFLPDFVSRNEGKILNTASTAGLLPGPLQAVYYATKAYVRSFSLALAEELSETNVTVTALLPGATESKFGATSGMSQTKLFAKTVPASVIAKDGYEAMKEGRLEVISGVPFGLRMSLLFAPFVPKKILLRIIKKGQELPNA